MTAHPISSSTPSSAAYKVSSDKSTRTRKVSFDLGDPYGVCVSWYGTPDDKNLKAPPALKSKSQSQHQPQPKPQPQPQLKKTEGKKKDRMMLSTEVPHKKDMLKSIPPGTIPVRPRVPAPASISTSSSASAFALKVRGEYYDNPHHQEKDYGYHEPPGDYERTDPNQHQYMNYPSSVGSTSGYAGTGGVYTSGYTGAYTNGWYAPSYNYNDYTAPSGGYNYNYTPYYPSPRPMNICGNPLCGRGYICAADYNRNIQYRYMYGMSGGR